MIKGIDLNETKNLYVVASIFISGIGGLFLKFGSVEISSIACALIVGILINLMLNSSKKSSTISENSSLLQSEDTVTINDNKENKKENGVDIPLSKIIEEKNDNKENNKINGS